MSDAEAPDLGAADLPRDAQQLAIGAMELLTWYPWLVLVSPTPVAGTALLVGLGCCYLLALAAARCLVEPELGRLRLADRQLIATGLAVVVALAVTKLVALPEYAPLDPGWLGAIVEDVGRLTSGLNAVTLTLAASLGAWWRGLTIAQAEFEPAEVVTRFQIGILSLGAVTLVGALSGHPVPGLILFMLGFFLAGLAAVALGRARSAVSAGRPLDAHWLGVLLAFLALVLVCGTVVGLIVSAEAVRPLFAPVEWALGLIQRALLLIALILALLVEPIATFLAALIRDRRPPETPPQPNGLSDLYEMLREGSSRGGVPPEVEAALRWLSAAILVAAALWLIARSLRLRQRTSPAAAETRESLASGAELLAQLRSALLNLLNRLLGRASPAPSEPALEPDELAAGPSALAATRSVRQIYRDLLRWADGRGWGRPASRTPREYEGDLDPRLPAAAADLDALTRLYERARYGASPATEAEAREAEGRLARVKAAAPEPEPGAARAS